MFRLAFRWGCPRSILDLSAAEYQSMVVLNGRFVIAGNRELYRHPPPRADLASHARVERRGHSDTETLMALVERLGLEPMLQRSVGMFALAL